MSIVLGGVRGQVRANSARLGAMLMLLGVLIPSSSWAFSCPSSCVNDLAVGDALPVGAGGVIWFTGGTDAFPALTESSLDVSVYREVGGVFEVVEYELEDVFEGTRIRPVEPMQVGDVFRIETVFVGAEVLCGDNGSVVTHEFEVVETPELGSFVGLSVGSSSEAPGLEECFSDDGTPDYCSAMLSSAEVTVTLPSDLAALGETLYIQVEKDGRWRRPNSNCYARYLDPRLTASPHEATVSRVCLEQGGEAVDVSVRLHVLGMDSDWTSEAASVVLECGPQYTGSPDAGGTNADAGAEPDADAGGGALADGGGVSAQEGQGAGGCAAAPGRAPSPLRVFLFIVAGFIWMKRSTRC